MCALNINPFINNLSHCIYISFHWPPQKCPRVFVIPRACIPQPRCNLLKPRLYFFREGSPPRFQGGQAQRFQNMAKMPSRAQVREKSHTNRRGRLQCVQKSLNCFRDTYPAAKMLWRDFQKVMWFAMWDFWAQCDCAFPSDTFLSSFSQFDWIWCVKWWHFLNALHCWRSMMLRAKGTAQFSPSSSMPRSIQYWPNLGGPERT